MRFFNTLKRFMSVNKDYLPYFYVTLAFLIVNQGLVAYTNYSIGNLTDAITATDIEMFRKNILFLVVVQILHLMAGYQVNYRVNHLSESFVKRLRSHTYKKITNASMKWLDENKLGDIISRIKRIEREMADFRNKMEDDARKKASEERKQLIADGILVYKKGYGLVDTRTGQLYKL